MRRLPSFHSLRAIEAAARLADFLRRHPELQLRLSSGAEPVDLAGRDDVIGAIAYGRMPRRPGAVMHALGRERIAPMTSPTSAWCRRARRWLSANWRAAR